MYSNKDLFRGLFWSGLDKFGFVVIQLLLELILARLLLPKDYGVIGVVLVFISLSVTISEGGFSNALIHKQSRDETDFATVFYFNMMTAAFIYLLIFFTAPFIETFFKIQHLSTILRVVSVSIILNSSILVHKAKLSIAMDFKLQAKLSVLSVFLSGIIGVGLAYSSYGVWALVWQNITMAFFNALFLWIGYKWIPKPIFSYLSLQKLFSFGSKILASAIIQAVYFNAYPLFIGRVLGTRDLGLYSKSSQFTQMPSSVLTTIVQRVLFPFFSSHQNDSEKIFQLNQFYTKICCLLFFPIFFMMAALSQPLILLLFSKTWEDMTPLFVLLCIAYTFYPLIVNNMMLFQIKNKTSLFLKIEILTKIIGFVILISTIKHGIIALGLGILAQQLIQFLITSFFAQFVLKRDLFSQIFITLPPFLFSLALFLGVHYLTMQLSMSLFLKTGLGLLVSLLLYAIFYLSFYQKFFKQLLTLIKK